MELLKPYEMPRGDRSVARFLRTVISAVGALHRHGYVHRDIKPSNILMRTNGAPVLVDFRLACPLSQIERDKNAPSTARQRSAWEPTAIRLQSSSVDRMWDGKPTFMPSAC